jgi:hypothetical protein
MLHCTAYLIDSGGNVVLERAAHFLQLHHVCLLCPGHSNLHFRACHSRFQRIAHRPKLLTLGFGLRSSSAAITLSLQQRGLGQFKIPKWQFAHVHTADIKAAATDTIPSI